MMLMGIVKHVYVFHWLLLAVVFGNLDSFLLRLCICVDTDFLGGVHLKIQTTSEKSSDVTKWWFGCRNIFGVACLRSYMIPTAVML